jgi:hypothetical protein
MPVDRPYYPNPQAIAQAVCNDWAQVGVKCNLKTKDWTAYLDDARNHKLPAWMGGWTGDNGDPDNFLFYFFGIKPGLTVANNNTWDIWMVGLFGVIGYVFIKLGLEPAPLLLGFILGPMMEENLRRALLLSRGDWSVLVTRPLSAGLLAMSAGMLLMVLLPTIKRKREEAFVKD